MKNRIFSKRNIIICLALFTAVCSLTVRGLRHVDFLGDMVLDQVDKAVTKQLGVDLSVSPLSGNPITGFSGKELALSRSGDKLLTVDNIEIRLSLPSLLKNSPRVGVLEVTGLSSDIASLNKLMPKKKTSSGPTDIPIDKVVFKKASIGTEWGTLQLDNSRLWLKGSEWFKLDTGGKIKDIASFALSGVICKKNGSWTAEGIKARLDDGTAEISGVLTPVPDLKIATNNINISTVSQMFPQVRNSGIRGILSASCSFKGNKPDNIIFKGSGTLTDAVLRGIPIKGFRADWDYNKGLLMAKLDGSKIYKSALSAAIKFDNRPADKYMEVSADIKNLRFADWTDKFKEELHGNAGFLRGGISSLTANIRGPLNALMGSVKIAPSDINYDKLSLKALQGAATFDGTPSGTVDFSAMHNGKKLTLRGSCSLAGKVPTNLKFSSEGFSLDEFASRAPALKKYNVKGIVGVDASISGVTKKWLLNVKLSSKSVSAAKVGTVSNIGANATYSLADGSLKLHGLTAEWNGARVTGSGSTNTSSRDMALDFSGTIQNASAEKLYPLLSFLKVLKVRATTSGTWGVKGTTASPEALLALSINNGWMRNLRIDRFDGNLIYKDGAIRIPSMKARAGEGSAIMAGDVSFRGKGNVKWNISGDIANLALSDAQGLAGVSEDIDGRVSASASVGNSGSGLKWNAYIKDCHKARWRNFRFDSVSGKANGNTNTINIDGIKVLAMKGTTDVNGSITLAPAGKPAADARLALKVSAEKLNIYELMRRHLSSVRGVQGLIKGSVAVSGTAGFPEFSGMAVIAPLRFRGFMLPMLDVSCTGNLKKITISDAAARLHGGTMIGSGVIFENKGKWRASARINAENVDMRQIGMYLPEKFRSGLEGKANFDMKGSGPFDNFSGKGSFTSSHMKIMGVKFEDIHAPFFISDGFIFAEDVRAVTNNGRINGGIACDPAKSYWGGNIRVASADLQPLIKQATPSLKGSITGKGDLAVRVEGETGRLSTFRGGGLLTLYNGQVVSFDAVEAAKKFTKGKPIRYEKLHSTFTFDGSSMTILPGSSVSAPKGDSVYRYLMLDGLLNRDGKISLMMMGKFNIRALNTLLGAMQGLINSGMSYNKDSGSFTTNDLLQDFLGGVLSGYSKSDFRFVTMNIGGTVQSPTFNNIKVDRNINKSAGSDVIPKSASDPDEDKISNGDLTIRMKFEVPVGPGTSGVSNSVGGQFFEQTLENIIHNIDLTGQ